MSDIRDRSMALALASAFVLAACGPSLPPRYVLERDIGPLSYRRYQRVLDVEFPVAGNDAVGHTATYVRRSSAREIPYVNVFVTVYDHAPGLAAEIRRQIRSLGSYEVRVVDVSGRAWELDGGEGDRWLVWVSANRVVKVGGVAEAELLRSVAETYMGTYSSDLDEHGRARSGAPSAGSGGDAPLGSDEENLELPRSLQSEALAD